MDGKWEMHTNTYSKSVVNQVINPGVLLEPFVVPFYPVGGIALVCGLLESGEGVLPAPEGIEFEEECAGEGVLAVIFGWEHGDWSIIFVLGLGPTSIACIEGGLHM